MGPRALVLVAALGLHGCTAAHVQVADDDADSARDARGTTDARQDDARVARDAGSDAALGHDAGWWPLDAPVPPCAGDASAATDARRPTTDAPSARDPVTVVIRNLRHVPLAHEAVVFHDASGAPLAMVRTDATGTATCALPGVAAITARVSEPAPGLSTHMLLYTLWDVAPGETIVFDWPMTERTVVLPAFEWGSFSGYSVRTPIDGRDVTTPTAVTMWDVLGPASIIAGVSNGSGFASSSVGATRADTVTLPPWSIGAAGARRYRYEVVGCPAVPLFASVYAGTVAARMPIGIGGLAADTGGLAYAFETAPDVPRFVSGTWAEGGVGTRTTSYEVSVRALPDPGPAALLDVRAAPVPEGIDFTVASLGADWIAPNDAALTRLDLNYHTRMIGPVWWRVVTTSPRGHLAAPTLPRELGAFDADPTSPRGVRWALSFDTTECVRDAAAFRAHPFGPFDRGCWAGGTTTVSDVALR